MFMDSFITDEEFWIMCIDRYGMPNAYDDIWQFRNGKSNGWKGRVV